MSFEIPNDLKYTESHEWIDISETAVTIGITDFAQDELGDIVFVELPEVGDDIEEGDPFITVESIKAVSDVYAPISGTVIECNESLFDDPEQINAAPYDDGWLVKLDAEVDDTDDLLDNAQYENQIE